MKEIYKEITKKGHPEMIITINQAEKIEININENQQIEITQNPETQETKIRIKGLLNPKQLDDIRHLLKKNIGIVELQIKNIETTIIYEGLNTRCYSTVTVNSNVNINIEDIIAEVQNQLIEWFLEVESKAQPGIDMLQKSVINHG